MNAREDRFMTDLQESSALAVSQRLSGGGAIDESHSIVAEFANRR